jgi:hypothetical protein
MSKQFQVKDAPPAEEFWKKYSPRFEFPLSTVAAVLLHVAVGAFVVFVLFRLANHTPDRVAVPLTLVDSGFDDHGAGVETPGGTNAEHQGETNPLKPQDTDLLPDPTVLPLPTAPMPDLPIPTDPNADGAAIPNNSAFSKFDKLVPKGIPGGRRGEGDPKGNGPVAGPDSTAARTQRWVLRFRTASGQDYVNQLAVMGGTIVVPVPPENKEFVYFPNLRNLKNVRPPTLEDTRLIAKQIKFGDSRKDSVAGVVAALNLSFTPKSFWAVFPKGIEDELDRKERAYRNRRPEDIAETIFRVRVLATGVEIVVEDQLVKR